MRGAIRIWAAVLSVAILAVLLGCNDGGSGGSGAADEWTMLGHDLRSSYSNSAQTALSLQNAADLHLRWQFEARGQVYGTPAVVGDMVYVSSTGGLYAFDGDSGAMVWQNLEIGATSSLTYSEGAIFVHDFRAFLRALDAATGEELWQTRTDTHPLATGLSSPVVFERYVVVGLSSNEIVREGATFRGGVAAFDRDTGEQLWRDYTANPPHNGASVWSTVAIDSDARVVFAGSGQNYTGEAGPNSDALFAIDLDTGERLWTNQTVEGDVFTPINPRGPDADFGANPILFEAEIGGVVREMVGAGQKNGMFWALDRVTGEAIWERRLGSGSPLTGGVLNNGAFDGERILVANNDPASGHGTLFALNPSDGEIVWQRDLTGWVWAPITVSNGVGIVAADTVLTAFDIETGEELFRFPTQGTIACGASIVGGRVHFGSGMQHIVGTSDRMLYVLGLPGDIITPIPTPSPGDPSGDATLGAIYDDVFVGQGCNTPLCHGGSAGGLSMATKDEAYSNLVGRAAAGAPCVSSGSVLVEPGEPAQSLLWDKVSTRTPLCGSPMPISSSLPGESIERIRSWIERGAPND
jgi:polyvinyl alcohol dehydrogenase (cytochrome)